MPLACCYRCYRFARLRGFSALQRTQPVHRWPTLPSPRLYATENSLGNTKSSSRKQVTVIGDDGRVQWKELTVGEKAARTTQQTFNFGVILLGLSLTVGIANP